VESEKYSISKYNSFEVKMNIHQDTYYFGLNAMDRTPWESRKGVKESIKKFSKEYFSVIENWIFNYLIKNNLQSIEDSKIEKELIEWLLTNEDIKKLEKPIMDRRIISKIVFTVNCNLDKKSKKIYHCWGEVGLKNNNDNEQNLL